MTKQFNEFMNELKSTMVQKVSEQRKQSDDRDKIERSIKLLMGLDPKSDLSVHMGDIYEFIQMDQSVMVPALKELVRSYDSIKEPFTQEELSRLVTMGFMIDTLLKDESSIVINDDGSLTIHDDPEFWKTVKLEHDQETVEYTTEEETEESTEETSEETVEETVEETLMESSSNQLAESFIESSHDPELRMVRLTWLEGVPVYRYFITNTGFVMERIKDRICKTFPRKQLDEDRELIVQLTDKKKAKVSHLVWEAFYPEFRNVEYTLMYADGDPNNCALNNLQLQLKRQPNLK